MDRAILSKRITSILSDISRLNSALYALNTTDIQRYQNTWQTAQASWVTIVRKYTTTPDLPKTGY